MLTPIATIVLQAPYNTNDSLKVLSSASEDLDQPSEIIIVDSQKRFSTHPNLKNSNVISFQSIHGENPVDCINTVFKNGQGEVLVFIKAGILIDFKKLLRRTKQFFSANPKTGAIGISGWKEIENTGNCLRQIYAKDKNTHAVLSISPECLIIPKKRFDEIGGFDHTFCSCLETAVKDMSLNLIACGFEIALLDIDYEHYGNLEIRPPLSIDSQKKIQSLFSEKWKHLLPVNTDKAKPKTGKICCTLRVKDEEAYIGECLQSVSRIVDDIIVLDDGSTDKTPEICQSFENVTHYEYQKKPLDEGRDRSYLLQKALTIKPDWILSLDGDEVLTPNSRFILQSELANSPGHIQGIEFNFLVFWDAKNRFRIDPIYFPHQHIRVFSPKRIDVSNYVFTGTEGANFHCGSVPRGLVVRKSNIVIKHYGYLEYRNRLKKYNFYKSNDNATDYKHICPPWGSEMPVVEYSENMTWPQILHIVNQKGRYGSV